MKSGLHLLWASLLIGTMTVSANPIDVTQAQGIAKKFCSEAVVKNKMRKAPSNAKMKLVYKSILAPSTSTICRKTCDGGFGNTNSR